MDKLLKEKKVLVVVGSGGVGKTTLSASLGVRAAELGLKTLVLTIDPAKRLATSLGLKDTTGEVVEVPSQQFSGKLFAAILNPKKVFDRFVQQTSNEASEIERLMNNRLYHQLTTRLQGSQEFTALEQLYSYVNSGEYDLVILDTPPAQHAVEFLNAPKKLHQVFDERVIKWFSKGEKSSTSFVMGLVSKATAQAFKTLKSITGSEFIDELGDFFYSIRNLRSHLQSHTAGVHKLLTGPETSFLIVTSFDESKIEEAIGMQRDLKMGGYSLSAILVNRAFPQWLGEAGEIKDSDNEVEGKLFDFYKKLNQFFQARTRVYDQLEAKIDNVADMVRIPDFNQDIHNIDSLKTIADLVSTWELKVRNSK